MFYLAVQDNIFAIMWANRWDFLSSMNIVILFYFDCKISLSLQYIFEGLGPLIANILMTSVIHIRRINENGIKKMCRNIFSIQQQLTNITMTRELALDQARQYYEMLYHTPEVS